MELESFLALNFLKSGVGLAGISDSELEFNGALFAVFLSLGSCSSSWASEVSFEQSGGGMCPSLYEIC